MVVVKTIRSNNAAQVEEGLNDFIEEGYRILAIVPQGGNLMVVLYERGQEATVASEPVDENGVWRGKEVPANLVDQPHIQKSDFDQKGLAERIDWKDTSRRYYRTIVP